MELWCATWKLFAGYGFCELDKGELRCEIPDFILV